jgi:hypothetical protein
VSSDKLLQRKPRIESAAIAGIVYSVLSAVAIVLLRLFDPTLSDQALVSWFSDEGNRWWVILGLNLVTLSSVAFLWFVAVIRRRIGDREDRFFATVFLGSAIAWVVIWMAGAVSLAAVPIAQGFADDWTPTPDSIRVTSGLAAGWLLVVGPRIQALFVFSTSTVFLRTEALPKWLAYVGYAMGLSLFFIPLVWRPVLFGFPIWVLIASSTILLVRGTDQPRDDPTASA